MRRRILAPIALVAVTGCLDGDPNPTKDQASSSGSAAAVATVQPSSACSKASNQAVNVTFHNLFTDRSVRLYWVDYTCKEIAYDVIAPGQSHVQATFATHPWRIRDAQTGALYKEYVTDSAATDVAVP